MGIYKMNNPNICLLAKMAEITCYWPSKCSFFFTWNMEAGKDYIVQTLTVQTGTATVAEGLDLSKVMKGKLLRVSSWDQLCLGIPERPKT